MQFTPRGESLEQPDSVSGIDDTSRVSPAFPVVAADEQVVERPSVFRFHRVAFVVTGTVLALIVLAGVTGLLLSGKNNKNQKSPNSYAVSNSAGQGVQVNEQLAVEPDSQLAVNGQLKVGNSLVLVPTGAPSAPQTGQIYYDKTANTLYFYNGTRFVNLEPQKVKAVTSLGGASGLISVGNGLQITNGQLSLTPGVAQSAGGSKVTSLQGQTGDVSLIAGGGISINGTTITNRGVVNISGVNGLSVSAAGGHVTLGLPQALGASDTPSFAGLSLSNPLGIASGGTGSSTFNTGGVVYSNGTALVSSPAPASNGLCLVSTSSGPEFGSCSGGSAVTSLNSLAGVLQLQGGSGVTIADNGSDTITISATGATGANTSLSNLSGVALNTNLLPDSTNTESLGSNTLNFKDLWLGGNANVSGTVNGAHISGTAISGSGALSVAAGGTNQNLTLQGSGTGSVVIDTPIFHNAGGATYGFAAGDASSVNATICTTTGNCGGVTGSAPAGTIAVFAGSGTTSTIGGSILSQSGTTLTVAGDTIQGTGALTIMSGGNEDLTLQASSGSVVIQTPTFHNSSGATYSFDSSDNGTVNATVCTTQGNCTGVGGGVTSPGGTANQLAKFINGQAIGNSIISDDGTTATIAGSAVIQGGSGLSIGTSSVSGVLALNDGASHITSLKSASLSGSNLTFVLPGSYGTSGQCIKTNGSGSLSFGDCLNSTTGVSSIVGASGGTAASGNITLNNATTTSSAITIDNASTGAKGIASFSSTDFSVSSGAVSLNNVGLAKGGTGGTDAASARANLQAAESGANGDITSMTALTAITPSSALTIGATGQKLTLQGNANTTLTATSSGHTTTVGFAAPTANVTYNFAAASAGTYDICTTQGNCVGTGGGVTTSGGTANQLAKFTGGQAIGNSNLSDDGTTFTIGDSAIAGTGALAISAGGTNQNLSLQGSGSGSVVIQTPSFKNVHGATYSFDSSDTSGVTATVCTTQGNCAGAGGGVTGSGAAGTIAVFTGSGTTQTIGGSILSQNSGGTTLTVAGGTVQGTGALTVSSGGSNQNLTLQGTGTGVVAVSDDLTVSGTSTLQGTVNAVSGLQTGSTTRIDASGGLQNVSFGAAAGALVTGSAGAISLASGATTGYCLISGGTGTAPSFQACPSGGGVSTIGAIDTQTKSSNGAVISGSTIYLQSADASNPGLVTATGNQTFGGNKTFTGTVAVQNASAGTVLNVNPVTSTLSLLAPTLTYIGGIDASGNTNSGTSSLTFNDVIVSGHYEYAATNAVSGICPPASPATKGNCELRVTDISNPAAPTYVGGASSCNTITSTCNQDMPSIAMSGHYIYAATDGGNSGCGSASPTGCEFKVYDVSNPSTPTFVGGADATGSTNAGGGFVNFTSVTVSGHYAYVTSLRNNTACSQTAGSAIGCELKVFDITNPAAPTYVGGADSSGSTNSGTGLADFTSVTVSGRYAYVTSFNSGTSGTACSQTAGSAIGCELQIYDISNPATPTYVAGVDSSGSANAGTGTDQLNSVTVSGRYAYVTSAADATACSATAGSALGCELKVFDVSNPTAPAYAAGVDASGATNTGTGSKAFTSTAVAGGYAYVTTALNTTACAGTAGNAIGCELQEYNVSDPTNPAYVGGADASGSTNSGAIGQQFNSVAISGRHAYVATNSSASTCSATAGSALGCENKVFDVSGIDAPAVQAGSTETGALQVDNDGMIYGNLNIQGSLAVGQGVEVNGALGVAGNINTNGVYQINGSTVLQAPGTNNFFIGPNAGNTSLTGADNYALGVGALQSVTSGSDNIAIGLDALQSNTTGYDNTTLGSYALNANTTGHDNVGLGYYSLTRNVSGNGNTAVGGGTLQFNTTGGQNVALGYIALASNVSGSQLIAIGNGADVASSNLTNSTVIGYNAQVSASNTVVLGNTSVTCVIIGQSQCNSTEKLGVVGNILASGTITGSSSPDIAETIPTASDVEAYDVVSAGPDGGVNAVRSQTAYDSTAIGVISDGSSTFKINANSGSESAGDTGKYMVLAGRVPVHVTNEGGAIKPGDYLTTSSTPGYAMKATHAGPTIGKALAAFDGTSGTVMAQVNLSYYGGPTQTDMIQNGGNATLSDLTVGGTANMASLNVSGETTLNNLTVTGSVNIAGDLTVQSITTDTLTVNGHIITGGKTPTVVVGAADGSGSVTIDGDDTSGTITITTGSGPLDDGDLGSITFNQPYSNTPRIVMTGQDDNSVNARIFPSDKTGAGFKLSTGTPLQPNTKYTFDYFITQ